MVASSLVVLAALFHSGQSAPAPAPTLAEGLTLRSVLSNVPHDPFSVLVMALLVVTVVAIVHFGRDRPGTGGRRPT